MDETPNFTYRPIFRSLWRERYPLAAVVIVLAAVIAYRALFPAVVVQEDRIARYERVIGELGSLAGEFKDQKEEGLSRARDGGVGFINAKVLKEKLYRTYDYMYIWEMRQDSPFFDKFPPQEQELIHLLQDSGKVLDAALIEAGVKAGNPATQMDYEKVIDRLARAREILNSEKAKR